METWLGSSKACLQRQDGLSPGRKKRGKEKEKEEKEESFPAWGRVPAYTPCEINNSGNDNEQEETRRKDKTGRHPGRRKEEGEEDTCLLRKAIPREEEEEKGIPTLQKLLCLVAGIQHGQLSEVAGIACPPKTWEKKNRQNKKRDRQGRQEQEKNLSQVISIKGILSLTFAIPTPNITIPKTETHCLTLTLFFPTLPPPRQGRARQRQWRRRQGRGPGRRRHMKTGLPAHMILQWEKRHCSFCCHCTDWWGMKREHLLERPLHFYRISPWFKLGDGDACRRTAPHSEQAPVTQGASPLLILGCLHAGMLPFLDLTVTLPSPSSPPPPTRPLPAPTSSQPSALSWFWQLCLFPTTFPSLRQLGSLLFPSSLLLFLRQGQDWDMFLCFLFLSSLGAWAV